jgi:hypothetical protein
MHSLPGVLTAQIDPVTTRTQQFDCMPGVLHKSGMTSCVYGTHMRTYELLKQHDAQRILATSWPQNSSSTGACAPTSKNKDISFDIVIVVEGGP